MQAKAGRLIESEMKAISPTLSIQEKNSTLPEQNEFLIEKTITKEGINWFLFPFAGRLANEGLAALVSYRMSQIIPMSLSVSFNDYGFHLCSNENLELGEKEWRELLTPDNFVNELLDCMNLSEMAKRQFREVARVAGLIFQGYPRPKICPTSTGVRRPSSMYSRNTILKIYYSTVTKKSWKGNLK